MLSLQGKPQKNLKNLNGRAIKRGRGKYACFSSETVRMKKVEKNPFSAAIKFGGRGGG